MKDLEALLGGGNLDGLLQQAQQMQQTMVQAKARAEAQEVTGESGGGMVKVRANGKLDVLSVTLDKAVVDPGDVEMLQDLIVAGVNDALRRAREVVAKELGPMAEALKASGMGF
ncbi:MAG: YbaB/EbfC family nucleoid-associated protein [Deltaproteobacteria bacterium]|nr:YbaB/EbfC family nucleoid-associated protein [Deltaproteobacteria bacterium]